MAILGNGVTLRLPINCAGSGDNTLLAAQATKKIAVYRHWFSAAAAVNAKFKHGAVDFHPGIPMAASEKWTLDFSEEPWFITAVNEALILNLDAAVQCSGVFYYGLID